MRVVIAEDQVLLRAGLACLFEDAGHDVEAAVGDADALLAAVALDEPDLVVVDVRMPPTFSDEGARAAGRIREEHPGVGVLVLSQHVETQHAIALVSEGGFGLPARGPACLTCSSSSTPPSVSRVADRHSIHRS